MLKVEISHRLPVAVLAAALLVPVIALASDEDVDQNRRIEELERTVGVLTEELEKTQAERAVPDEPELESVWGAGPAASKVYHVDKGLSIGGYGEAFYQNLVSDKGSSSNHADFVRLVLYAGYKFTDRILFNSEIEFEHTSTGKKGEVGVEFAQLDFLLREEANLRAGLLLVPMGFINEMHEPVTYFGNNRPDVERQIIPSTWRENGVGLFGRLGDALEYKLYAVNGFDGSDFSSSGLRGGRQKGSKALAEDLAVVARLDWFPLDGVQLGGSVYHGDSGQDQAGIPDTSTTIWELHTQYAGHDARVRGLFAMAHVGDAGALTAARNAIEGKTLSPVSSEMLGGYGEVAYNILPRLFPGTNQTLEPFYRYEYWDTQYDIPMGTVQDLKSSEVNVHTVGISYKPISQVVIKLDYRNRDALASLADEFNLGIGFVF